MTIQSRRIILVTGSPRSGTTPVGDALAHDSGSASIYEPMGPTGDVRFNSEFPIPGTGELSSKLFSEFVTDLRGLNLKLHPQVRPSHANEKLLTRVALKFTGTRTLHTLRLARMQPWKSTLIWKDPHAILAMPDVLLMGIPVVVTSRPALAQAASYKRLRWRTRLGPIYQRFRSRYGPDDAIESVLKGQKEESSPVISAAVVWRMAHLLIMKHRDDQNLHFIQSTDLAKNETKTYTSLARDLGLDERSVTEHVFKRSKASADQTRDPSKIHDWGRSIEHTNTYWTSSLDENEINSVRFLTDKISESLS